MSTRSFVFIPCRPLTPLEQHIRLFYIRCRAIFRFGFNPQGSVSKRTDKLACGGVFGTSVLDLAVSFDRERA